MKRIKGLIADPITHIALAIVAGLASIAMIVAQLNEISALRSEIAKTERDIKDAAFQHDNLRAEHAGASAELDELRKKAWADTHLHDRAERSTVYANGVVVRRILVEEDTSVVELLDDWKVIEDGDSMEFLELHFRIKEGESVDATIRQAYAAFRCQRYGLDTPMGDDCFQRGEFRFLSDSVDTMFVRVNKSTLIDVSDGPTKVSKELNFAVKPTAASYNVK